MKTNHELQEILNHSEDYCPIDKDGNLQSEVTDETTHIIDVSSDEQHRHSDGETTMMCIYDREGENYYTLPIVKWW